MNYKAIKLTLNNNGKISNMKFLLLSSLFVLFIQSCIKDNGGNPCGNPVSIYYRNIDTTNIPYKKERSFNYKDKDGILVFAKIIKDTLFYNCVLQPVSNPDCGIQNSYCYINKQYFFDTLANVRIDSEIDRLFIIFDKSNFYVRTAPLLNRNMPDYPYYNSIFIANRNYYNVRLVTNSQNDSLYINYNEGILKVINSKNTYTIQ